MSANANTPGGRRRLPNCRPSITTDLDWNGQQYALTFSFDDSARIREVFGSSPKIGSDAAHTVSDAAIAISLVLQSSLTLREIARSISEDPDPMSPSGHRPASILGAILQAGFQLEAELHAK